MDLLRFDLNLLLCFEAIHKHHSLSAAGHELGLTQPAVSAALKRLRGHFDNPLFVRTSHGMRPTPFADELAPKVARVLEAIRGIDSASSFDPATTRINFRIYINDVGQLMLMPRVLAFLRAHAPLSRLTVVDLRPNEVVEALDSGAVDLAIGYFLGMPNWARQQHLRDTRYVCMVRQGHAEIRGSLSLEQFLRCGHAKYASSGSLHNQVEQVLAQRGLTHDLVLTVPRFSALPFLIAQSDLVATVPEDLGAVFGALVPLQLLPPPLELAAFQIKQYWHQRLHVEPGYRWFRQMVYDQSRGMAAPGR